MTMGTSDTRGSKSTSKSSEKCACGVCSSRIREDTYTYPICEACDAAGCTYDTVRRVS